MRPLANRHHAFRDRRGSIALLASILLGLTVFAAVFVVGRNIINDQPARWSAQAAVVIFPDDRLDTDLAANYYSTLSQGQVPNTVAEYFRLPGIRRAALDGLARKGPSAEDSEVVVEVVEGTSMITITADASRASVAERVADRILDVGEARIEELPVTRGYQLDVASRAEGTAERSGIDQTTFAAVLLLVAAVAAVATQQVVFGLVRAFFGGEAPSSPVSGRHTDKEEVERGVGSQDTDDQERDAALLELWGDQPDAATRTRPRGG